jgi:uncharacterized protein (TIGR03083 family)
MTMTDQPTLLKMAEAEQDDFVRLLAGLDAGQWMAPSLCQGLTVRDVAVHVAAHIHHDPSYARLLVFGVQARGSVVQAEKLIDREQQERHGAKSPQEIVDWLAAPITIGARLSRALPRLRVVREGLVRDTLIQLSELMIHQQDIRRAIQRPRVIPAEHLRAALDFAITRFGSVTVNLAFERAKGLRLVATDVGWTWGAGPHVEGPGEALMMAINGRPAGLTELNGPGTETLAARVGKWSSNFAPAG